MPSNPSRQRVSRAGIALIKAFEGYRARSARLPGGRYVIGYGHVRSAREGVEISEPDAHALLLYDLMPIEAAVNEWVFTPLTQNQFDALVSFAFNIGVKGFRTSEVLRRLNEGALLQAAATLEMWRQADLDGQPVVIDALVRRRAAEKALFLTPPGGHISASSAVLRPQLDLSAYMAVPRNRPEEVTIPLEGEVAVVNRSGPDGVAEAIIPAAPIEEPDREPPAAPAAPEPAPEPTPDPIREPTPEPRPEPEPTPELTPEREPALEPAAAGTAPAAPPSDDESDEAADDADDDTLVLPTFALPVVDAEREEEPDDETLAAARAAAAAVSARLHAILSNDDFVEEDDIPPAQPAPTRPVEVQDTLEFAGGAEPIRADEPEAEPAPLAEVHAFPRTDDVLAVDAESDRPLAAADGLASTVLVDDEIQPLNDDAPARPPTGAYLLLGLVGLMFIVGALVVLVRSPAAEEGQDGAASVAWILALLGVAGVSGALWFTLRGEEEEDQGL